MHINIVTYKASYSNRLSQLSTVCQAILLPCIFFPIKAFSDEAARVITEASDPDAVVIFGSVINDSYTGEIKVTVIATGFEDVRKEKPSYFQREHGSLQHQNSSQPQRAVESELDIPAFIRKKVG